MTDLRSMLPAVAVLGALLVGVAVLQERWIGRWSDVEDARLRSALIAGAEAFDADLTERINAVAAATIEVAARDEAAGDSLAARLATLAPAPLPMEAVYWIAPGPEPRLWRLADGGLVEAEWSEAGDEWRVAVTRDLRPGADGSLQLDNLHVPSSLPGFMFPAIGSPEAPFRFVLVQLDTVALADSLLPAMLAEHLPFGDTFEATIRASETAPPLFASGDAQPSSAPDLTRPVGLAPHAITQVTVRGDERTRVVEYDQSMITAGHGLWTLQAWHRAGSISRAVSGLRWRQRLLALGVLAVLGGAVWLLVRSALAQRRHAQRQMAFVAGVSHELRTPLAVLGSAGENLADGVVGSPEAVREYGALVRDESRRLSETVESVLALGGVDARAPSRERLSVADLIESAATQASGPLADARATVETQIEANLPDVQADATALTAAVRNLLVNAARHGGPQIRVTARDVDGDIEIAVEDDGTRPLASGDLFEPFVRGDASRPGSGIGLALVRRVAESHGGSATLTRTPEARTRATLRLPPAP